MKPWWTLSRFDIIWLSAWLTVDGLIWGFPHGTLDWAIAIAGWTGGWVLVSFAHHLWRTR